MASKNRKISEKEKLQKMMQDDGVKLLITVDIHFQGFLKEFFTDKIQAVERLHCNQCLDLKTELCPGQDLQGTDVLFCMQDQSLLSTFHID